MKDELTPADSSLSGERMPLFETVAQTGKEAVVWRTVLRHLPSLLELAVAAMIFGVLASLSKPLDPGMEVRDAAGWEVWVVSSGR